MERFKIVQGEAVGHWVVAHTGGCYSADCAQAVGLTKDGEIIAGVVYENWTRTSVVCHIAFEGNITRNFLGAVFRYAFDRCGVWKIIAPINSDNLRMIHLATHMGFIWEATIRDAQPNGDILLFTMTRNQCRFLTSRYERNIIGKTITASDS